MIVMKKDFKDFDLSPITIKTTLHELGYPLPEYRDQFRKWMKFFLNRPSAELVPGNLTEDEAELIHNDLITPESTFAQHMAARIREKNV